MSALTRRQSCGRLLTLVSGLAAARCATVSPQEERRLGQKEAEEVERTVGLVREPRLVQYVTAVGGRLAQAAGRSDIAWKFSVADEGDQNAFSLPGGFVYVTRGLLALVNREDELAGVLAHEMAHVTERHAVNRVGAATPLAVLFGVPGGILGMVSPTLGGIVGGTGKMLSGLTLAPYSREQEHEADRVGIAFAARAGWDPRAVGEFLATLDRAESLAAGGGAKRSSFFPAWGGETVAQVIGRGGAAWSPALAAVANGIAPDRPLERDFPLKLAVAQRYRPPGQRETRAGLDSGPR
jgi:predicted Zn-dependent protease